MILLNGMSTALRASAVKKLYMLFLAISTDKDIPEGLIIQYSINCPDSSEYRPQLLSFQGSLSK